MVVERSGQFVNAEIADGSGSSDPAPVHSFRGLVRLRRIKLHSIDSCTRAHCCARFDHSFSRVIHAESLAGRTLMPGKIHMLFRIIVIFIILVQTYTYHLRTRILYRNIRPDCRNHGRWLFSSKKEPILYGIRKDLEDGGLVVEPDEQMKKGFGANIKAPIDTNSVTNPGLSRSEKKKKYQELKQRAKKMASVHKIVGGKKEKDSVAKQRSQAW